MVGTHRRTLFVPVPSFHDVRRFNERLLKDSLDLSDKRHYRLGVPQLELFEGDRAALLPLPAAPFSCVRWEARTRRANKQGEVVLGGILVLDEFGYVPFDVNGARLLYQVISESYERRAIIFATNIEFPKWDTVFADDKLAQAIVDRVVHHGRLVEYAGPSHRLETR